MRTRHTLALLLTACQAPPATDTSFGSAPIITSSSASTDSSSSTTGSTSTTSAASSADTGTTVSTTEPLRDLGGLPDFGDPPPVGCKGKIDFLFVISRQANMDTRQAQLASAFPQFIATIESKFADFDYHIMVVDGDDGWGFVTCTELCPSLSCKVGEDCCEWSDPDWEGQLCCQVPDYPCAELHRQSKCDTKWGAGTVFPAGGYASNKYCPIDGDLRYLVKGQSDLAETFACIAKVGVSGYDLLGQALVAAVQKPINDPGGCNRGFLRKDALLMVTFIAANPDEPELGSEGTPAEWAQAVIDAKHGDEKSVVMLSIFFTDAQWKPSDRIGTLVNMFTYHHKEYSGVADYGPAFTTAANLVDTACAGFIPPG